MTCPNTAIKATVAAGGYKHLKINMPSMDSAAAIGMASRGSLIRLAAVMPTRADTVLPAITAEG